MKTTPETFWAKVNKHGPVPEHNPALGSCWLWQGTILKNGGYGQVGFEGKTVYVHVLAFFFEFGIFPLGEADHLCRVRACVNPSHLDDVTRQENNRRRVYKRKLYCPYGHAMTPENTRTQNGHHGCKTCLYTKQNQKRALARRKRN